MFDRGPKINLLVEALADDKPVSFITVFDGHVSGVATGHRVCAIDLERNFFRSDCIDDPVAFAEVELLVLGENESYMQVELEDHTVAEFEAAVRETKI